MGASAARYANSCRSVACLLVLSVLASSGGLVSCASHPRPAAAKSPNSHRAAAAVAAVSWDSITLDPVQAFTSNAGDIQLVYAASSGLRACYIWLEADHRNLQIDSVAITDLKPRVKIGNRVLCSAGLGLEQAMSDVAQGMSPGSQFYFYDEPDQLALTTPTSMESSSAFDDGATCFAQGSGPSKVRYLVLDPLSLQDLDRHLPLTLDAADEDVIFQPRMLGGEHGHYFLGLELTFSQTMRDNTYKVLDFERTGDVLARQRADVLPAGCVPVGESEGIVYVKNTLTGELDQLETGHLTPTVRSPHWQGNEVTLLRDVKCVAPHAIVMSATGCAICDPATGHDFAWLPQTEIVARTKACAAESSSRPAQ